MYTDLENMEDHHKNYTITVLLKNIIMENYISDKPVTIKHIQDVEKAHALINIYLKQNNLRGDLNVSK